MISTHGLSMGSIHYVRTICMHPANIIHEHLIPGERKKIGIDDGFIRLPVGLENIEDIKNDLDQALANLF